MADFIEMPKLSDTMEEGGIASWLKKEGDFVKEGEAVVEIETDKATMEYNSPYEGYLVKILVPAGKSCQLNQPICMIGAAGEKFDPAMLNVQKDPSPSAKHSGEASKGTSVAIASDKASVSSATTADDRLRASPLAKKYARDHDVDLHALSGSGPNGRVVLKDVEKALHSAPNATIAQKGIESNVLSAPAGQPDQDLPVNMMRKTIAKRLHTAKNEAPHFYLTRSANMGRFSEWRARLNAEASERNLAKVSVNDLIILAVSRALSKHPEVNSSWQGEFIRRFGSVHIAVAVAIPDGLITPVIRNAHLLGARDIARLSQELVQKAKSGQLKPDEYQGGTFSISNLGMMGIEQFTAIINPPQAAILAVGATLPTPWVNKSGEVEVQQRMTMTLSCDHRVVDGAVGASFLATLVNYLEDPLLILA